MKQKIETKQVQMPPPFLEWQCDERRAMFAALRRGEVPRFLASHRPVVSTLNAQQGTYPIHSSTKGIGLLPTQRYVAEHTAEITDCLERCRDKDPGESLGDRIEVALFLYGQPERIDMGTFGGIEIFRGQTYHNLLRDPRASLLFTGFGPQYLSYQFNCDVEPVEPEDPRFLFLRGMRLLFDVERFHIQQPEYPLGYVYHIREVFDKTPHVVLAGKRRTSNCPVSATGSSGENWE